MAKSKQAQVLTYLKKHPRGITGRQAYFQFNLYRLSSAIFRLRQQGYDIRTAMDEEVDENGETVSYARYYLYRGKV